MYTIHIWMRCPSDYAEVLSKELERTELAVEALISQVMLEFFGMVIVEDITIKFEDEEGTESHGRM